MDSGEKVSEEEGNINCLVCLYLSVSLSVCLFSFSLSVSLLNTETALHCCLYKHFHGQWRKVSEEGKYK